MTSDMVGLIVFMILTVGFLELRLNGFLFADKEPEPIEIEDDTKEK